MSEDKRDRLNQKKEDAVNALAYLAGNIDNAKAIFMVSVVEREDGDSVAMMCFSDGNMSHLEMLGLSKIFEQKISEYMIGVEIENFRKQFLDEDEEEND